MYVVSSVGISVGCKTMQFHLGLAKCQMANGEGFQCNGQSFVVW